MIRTMRGQLIDINKLIEHNKNAIAVTGSRSVRMNARGDIISSNGKILKSVEEMKKEQVVHKSKEKISLFDSEKMKKFYMKKKFYTPQEIQKNLQEMDNILKKESVEKNNNDFFEKEKIEEEKTEPKTIFKKSIRKSF